MRGKIRKPKKYYICNGEKNLAKTERVKEWLLCFQKKYLLFLA